MEMFQVLIGPTGPAGGGVENLNAAIPYEPWNLDITLSEFVLLDQSAFLVQFFAPCTSTYTNMVVFLTTSSTDAYRGNLGVSIYANNPGPIPGDGPGVPVLGSPLGQGVLNFNAGTKPDNHHFDIEFANSIDLSANTKYWAAVGAHNQSGNLFMGYP